jgi:hypothetical protein
VRAQRTVTQIVLLNLEISGKEKVIVTARFAFVGPLSRISSFPGSLAESRMLCFDSQLRVSGKGHWFFSSK